MQLVNYKRYYTRYFHCFYAAKILKNRKSKLLDVGCGAGGIAMTLMKNFPVIDFYGCDVRKDQLEAFKKNLGNLKINLLQCDAHKLPYKNENFDYVLMFDVLEHLRNPRKVLGEISRVSKKGSAFHLVVPLEAELTTFDGWIKLIFRRNIKRLPIGHINQFTLDRIKKDLKKENFKIKEVRYSYHLIYQSTSFIYFLFLYLFRKGKYLSLESGSEKLNKIAKILNFFIGYLVYIEDRLLNRIPGQTAHITSIKL